MSDVDLRVGSSSDNESPLYKKANKHCNNPDDDCQDIEDEVPQTMKFKKIHTFELGIMKKPLNQSNLKPS